MTNTDRGPMGAFEGYGDYDTTDQQAVTVAQIEAARRYIRGEDDAIAWAIQAAIDASPDRLASVSSASAEGDERYRHVKRGTEYAVIGRASLQNANAVTLPEAACMVVYRDGDGRLWAREESEFMDGRFEPIAASPEPVPATNQAGEVALREACERLLLAMTTRALRGRDHVPSMRDEQDAASALRAALATQPATSQEGDVALRAEVKRLRELLGDYGEKRAPVQGLQGGIPWDMHLRAYDGYCRQYSPQKSLIEGGCRGGFGVRELDKFIPGWRDELKDRADAARATPTPPTLSEDLREAIEQAVSVLERLPYGDWPGPMYSGKTVAANALIRRLRAALAQVKAS